LRLLGEIRAQIDGTSADAVATISDSIRIYEALAGRIPQLLQDDLADAQRVLQR